MYNKITVAQARAGKKVSQDEVAKVLGLSPNGYRNKENGITEFTVNEAQKLCEYFDMPFEAFLFDPPVAKKCNKDNGSETGT